jgi:ectoine hydroxylase-related dioxygenase (phytanoyl-CoA dioxygenase family)
MDWHSDLTHDETAEEGAMTRVTYNIPLVEFTWCNGAMEMMPGTHHLPRSFLADPFKDVAHIYPVPLRLRLGDALLRDGNGLHRGTPNLTDAPRPMLDQTYKAIRG